MAIDDINAKGGVLGKKLEPVVVDPASNWPLFAEKARQLLAQDKVAVVFGCWTSVSRKSVLPVFEELNGLLFYPVQYEGEEMSPNVFYTGAAPNQQAIPAVEYLLSEDGGGAKRFFLLGTDYVYPRTTNKILRAFLHAKGIQDKDIEEVYTPFGYSDYQTIVANIKKILRRRQKRRWSLPSTAIPTCRSTKELANQGLKKRPMCRWWPSRWGKRSCAASIPNRWSATSRHGTTLSPSIIRPTKPRRRLSRVRQSAQAAECRYGGEPTIRWKRPGWVCICGRQAVTKAGTTDVDKVREAMAGQTFNAPSGFTLTMDATNHHLHKPVMIGEIEGNGQFNVVWQTDKPVRAQPWTSVDPRITIRNLTIR